MVTLIDSAVYVNCQHASKEVAHPHGQEIMKRYGFTLPS